MCDYSLQHVASRTAKVGDKLITTNFKGSITHGFAAVGEPDVAVCLLPGTEIAFEDEVKQDGFFRSKTMTDQKTAIFRQINKDQPSTFHDALEFPDGQIVLLTRLKGGLRATVLQLPATTRAAGNAEALQRAAFAG